MNEAVLPHRRDDPPFRPTGDRRWPVADQQGVGISRDDRFEANLGGGGGEVTEEVGAARANHELAQETAAPIAMGGWSHATIRMRGPVESGGTDTRAIAFSLATATESP